MEWKELSKNDAKKYYETHLIQNEFKDKNDYDIKYANLKNKLEQYYNETRIELGIFNENMSIKNYKFDYLFAIKLYKLLTSDEFYMGEREASNDNIWRYIQLYIVPNIIIKRWGIENAVHLYTQSNRLYLKCLWWYVHLSYDGENTKEILMSENFSTDTIVQFTERTGKKGYQIALYRGIIYNAYKYKLNNAEFRKLMKLNSAKIKIINPFLVEGGIDSYVKSLIKIVRGI